MKYIIFALLLFAVACKEDDEPLKAIPDPFTGSWHMVDTYADIQLEVSFDVSRNVEYVFNNIKVKYKDIPANTPFTAKTYDKFADNDGFGHIQISGAWSVSPCQTMFCDKWIFLNLTYNKIIQQSGYIMSVRDLEIVEINQDPIILEDQVFNKR